MNYEDPKLQRRIAEVRERNQKMTALTLSILRNHLESEQVMNSYLLVVGVSRRKLQKMKFSEKLEKCKVLSKAERDEPWWDILNAANSLRNTIAHSLEPDKIDKRMGVLKEKFLATMTPANAKAIEGEPDDYIAMLACSTCAGFVANLESNAKADGTTVTVH